ncbi:T9SS type A sorting domain-containing protein [Hymenobacter caeli]|uniref:T9SS type A sorting domain-containing protein n=1 Tax=Hymenobacter caeli TaxID=2735894 RepID=A0ABX2FW55_9BACT|nr:T9SS type A sorting domain-containing protein [Hymenobacter caeli]NRT20539.1 hypothetical protein [Hymenobacter caeli]
MANLITRYSHFHLGGFAMGLALLTGTAGAAHAQTFAPVANYSAGAGGQPAGMEVADMNGDGYPDVVVSDGESQVKLLTNRKDGTLAPAVAYFTGSNSYPGAVAVGDLNKDGYLDIVTAVDAGAGVLLARQDGTFASIVVHPMGASLGGVAVSDVNKDGYPDLVMGDVYNNTVNVSLNKKDGTFAPAVVYAIGSTSNSQGLAIGDMNGDGYPDLVISSHTTSTVGVLLNRQDGTFAPAAQYSTGSGSYPFDAAVGDVNNDGALDIVAFNHIAHTAGVLLNRRGGTFAPVVAYAAGDSGEPLSGTLSDLNGDGYLDIVTANGFTTTVGGVLLNHKDGTFAPLVPYLVSADVSFHHVAAGDMNKDGKPDLITTNINTSTISVLLNTTVVLAAQPGAQLSAPQVRLFPNPGARAQAVHFTVNQLPASVHTLDATLCDAVGQAVSSTTLPVVQGEVQANIPTVGLSSGLYLLRLTVHSTQQTSAGSALLPVQRLSVQ